MASSFLLALPLSAAAQVVVTEIMYDLESGRDAGREWIEIYASETVNVTELRLVENDVPHEVQALGSALLPAGSYAVLADNPEKFRADHPEYQGFLFDSAFSLNNAGETIAITSSGGTLIDVVRYTNASANGTGDSLQRTPGGNQFAPGVPTPGASIPVSGLEARASQQKATPKTKKVAAPAAEKIEIVGKSDFPFSGETQIAAAAASGIGYTPWLLATSLLAMIGCLGLTYSRHLKKDEWDIIEESE